MNKVIQKNQNQRIRTAISRVFRRPRTDKTSFSSTTSFTLSHDVVVPKNKALNAVATASAVALLALLGMATLGDDTEKSVYATGTSEDGLATMAIGSETSMQLSVPNSVRLNIRPTDEGQFGRQSLVVTAYTNSVKGYTLTMQMTGGATLTRTQQVNNTTYEIGSLTESVTCASETDSACSEWTEMNSWGYRVSTGASYLPVSNAVAEAQEIKKTSTYSGGTETTTVYFASKLNNDIPTGDYDGVTINFVATTNPVTGSITYYKKTGDSTPYYTQDADLNASGDTTVTLDATAPTRDDGYTFKGWCDGTITTESNVDSCNGTEYATNDSNKTITLNATGPTTATLIAMWRIITPTITFNMDSHINKITVNSQEVTNGGTLTLPYGGTYTITPTYATGYTAADTNPITKTGGGTLSGYNYTVGTTNATITLASKVKSNLSLSATFDTTKVKSIAVRTGSTSGTVVATIVNNEGSTGNILTYGTNYYLVPVYEDGYTLDSWSKTGTAGTLSCVASGTCSSDATPYYTIGDGMNAVSLSAKSSVSYMQNISSATLASLMPNVGSTAELVDSRDGQTYTVGKLADGNYWLLDNLRLGAVALTEALSTSNTHMSPSVSFTLPASGTANFDSTNGYTNAAINTASANKTDSNGWKYGVYYNYKAASAGTITGSSNSSNASYDICPSGWRMPTGGSSGEYQALYTAYSSDPTNFKNALRTPLSGYFDNGSASNQGTIGSFWSSTRYNNTNMYRLYVNASSVYPQNSNNRYYGYSVRCIFGS